MTAQDGVDLMPSLIRDWRKRAELEPALAKAYNQAADDLERLWQACKSIPPAEKAT